MHSANTDPTQDFAADAGLSTPQVLSTIPDGRLASATEIALSGRLGRYEILDKIGQGGMGLVFKARDPILDRLVAIKTLRSGLFASSEETDRFFNEARAIAQFRHPHIVAIFEIAAGTECPYFSMEYVAGGTLAQRLPRYADAPREAAELVEKIARAVHYAHERKILHRDLKPGNILLDEQGEPRVGDFGLVKFLDADSDMTREGQTVGTMPYMSPEQAQGQNEDLTPAADVWSLGVILFEMLTGRRPFAGKSSVDVQRQICDSAPPRPSQLRAGLDRDLETILLKCLEKSAADRYASAALLADDLRAWRESRPIQARPLSRLQRVRRWLCRHWLTSSAAVLVVAIALGAWLMMAAQDPARRLAALQDDLRAGKPVRLIGETGGPAHHRVILGEGRSTATVTNDGMFTVSSWETCLVELLPDPGVDRYRFRAEVMHTQAHRSFPVGVFWSHERQPCEKGFAHVYCRLSFSDVFNAPKELAKVGVDLAGNTAQVKAHLVAEPGPFDPATLFATKPTTYPPVEAGARPWRKLAVEVTPEGITTSWDGVPMEGAGFALGAASKQAKDMMLLTAKLSDHLKDMTDVTPRFQPRQTLGLIVQEGAAKFRNVVVEPLEPK